MKTSKNNHHDLEISRLMDRYFNGETSVNEEQQLRQYFATSRHIPQDWLYLLPLFAPQREMSASASPNRWSVVWGKYKYIASTAAAVTILLGGYFSSRSIQSHSENYAIVNGKKIHDAQIAEEYALDALREVGWKESDFALEKLLI